MHSVGQFRVVWAIVHVNMMFSSILPWFEENHIKNYEETTETLHFTYSLGRLCPTDSLYAVHEMSRTRYDCWPVRGWSQFFYFYRGWKFSFCERSKFPSEAAKALKIHIALRYCAMMVYCMMKVLYSKAYRIGRQPHSVCNRQWHVCLGRLYVFDIMPFHVCCCKQDIFLFAIRYSPNKFWRWRYIVWNAISSASASKLMFQAVCSLVIVYDEADCRAQLVKTMYI